MAAPIGQPQVEAIERRLNRRYGIHLPLHYKVLRYGKVVRAGEGRTLNLSSAGAFFRCDAILPRGLQIEMRITWPAKIDDKAGLTLVVSGTLMRVVGQTAAVAYYRYYFKTRTLRDCDSSAVPGEANAVRTMAIPRVFPAAGE